MTDTVNVPQEMIDAVMKVPVGLDEDGAEVFPGPFAAAELVRVALAAAPKVEQEPCKGCGNTKPVGPEYISCCPDGPRRHPAPASDELLKAAYQAGFEHGLACDGVGDIDDELQSHIDRGAADFLAKHKGPQ